MWQLPWTGLKASLDSICDRLDRLESSRRDDPDLKIIHPTLKDLRHGLHLASTSLDSLDGRIIELEAQGKTFTMALSEGIEHVDRSERRIQATVRRARDKLKEFGYEDPGLDAEAVELRARDGKGSDDVGVQLVREEVAETSSIPGVSKAALRRVRGF